MYENGLNKLYIWKILIQSQRNFYMMIYRDYWYRGNFKYFSEYFANVGDLLAIDIPSKSPLDCIDT